MKPRPPGPAATQPTGAPSHETSAISRPKVPDFIPPAARAAYLAGWQAGSLTAKTRPLPGEIAHDIVRVLDSVSSGQPSPAPG